MPAGSVVLAVALGGAAGSLARLLVGVAIGSLGTLVINVTGSALVGFLARFMVDAPGATPTVRALLITGFCGGYTTFSTFSFEVAQMIQAHLYGRAAVYIASSVTLSVAATFAGLVLAAKVAP